MAAREPGTFRRQFFGGFNRKDVLTYIKLIYGELDLVQTENEALLQRCRELEDLVEELQNAAASGAWISHPPVEEAAPPHSVPPPATVPAPVPVAEVAPPEEKPGWVCDCGHVSTGRFCMECGLPKPVDPEPDELENQVQMDSAALRRQCDELKNLVQNLEQPTVAEIPPSPVVPPPPPPPPEPAPAPVAVPQAMPPAKIKFDQASAPSPAAPPPTKVKVQPVKVKVRRM